MLTHRTAGPTGPPRTTAPPFRDTGFTLIEVTIGIVLVTIALIGFSTILATNERTHETAHEEAVVSNHFRFMAETLRGATFNEVVANYQDFSYTLGEIGGSGSVRIFIDETDISAEAQLLGLPRDLNGDGQATTTNISGGYSLLPIELQTTWTGPQGPVTRRLYIMLSQEE